MTCVLAACAVAILPAGGGAGEKGADDPVGSWKLKFVSADGKTRESVLTLFREGTALRGNYTADSMTRAARDVAYARGELRFSVDGVYAGQNYTLTYKGRHRGEDLRGAVRWKFGLLSGSYDFQGVRLGGQVAANP